MLLEGVDYIPLREILQVTYWANRACQNITVLRNGIVTGTITRKFEVQILEASGTSSVAREVRVNIQPLVVEITDSDSK